MRMHRPVLNSGHLTGLDCRPKCFQRVSHFLELRPHRFAVFRRIRSRLDTRPKVTLQDASGFLFLR
jgi:hypothetical protein